LWEDDRQGGVLRWHNSNLALEQGNQSMPEQRTNRKKKRKNFTVALHGRIGGGDCGSNLAVDPKLPREVIALLQAGVQGGGCFGGG